MCDLVVGALAPIHSRFVWMDFLHGYVDGTAAMIIPKPQPYKSNISAIAKPFQSWVNNRCIIYIITNPWTNKLDLY